MFITWPDSIYYDVRSKYVLPVTNENMNCSIVADDGSGELEVVAADSTHPSAIGCAGSAAPIFLASPAEMTRVTTNGAVALGGGTGGFTAFTAPSASLSLPMSIAPLSHPAFPIDDTGMASEECFPAEAFAAAAATAAAISTSGDSYCNFVPGA